MTNVNQKRADPNHTNCFLSALEYFQITNHFVQLSGSAHIDIKVEVFKQAARQITVQ